MSEHIGKQGWCPLCWRSETDIAQLRTQRDALVEAAERALDLLESTPTNYQQDTEVLIPLSDAIKAAKEERA